MSVRKSVKLSKAAMDIQSLLVLLEIIFPFIGIAIIIYLAQKTKGKNRWLVLFIAPAILLGLHFLLLDLELIDGNLLTISILGLMIMGVWYYYIILVIVALVFLWKWYKEKYSQ